MSSQAKVPFQAHEVADYERRGDRGLALSWAMVRRARAKDPISHNPIGIVANVTRGLPFRDGAFPLVFSLRFFHHLHLPEHRRGVSSGDDGGRVPRGPRFSPVPGGPCPSHRPAQERLEADFEPQSQAEAGKIEYGLADIRNTSLGRRPVSNKDQRIGFLSTRALPEAIKRALLA